MAERNTNQPKQIKCKTWLNKWFSQFQQVSVHGPDCSRSRGNCGTEEQDCCLFLGFCLESGPISPSPPAGWDALMPWHPRELWRECPNVCVTPGLALGALFQHLRHEGVVIMRSRGYKVHCSRHIRGSTCTILTGDVLWQSVLLLPNLVLRAPVWYSSCPSHCSPGQRCPVRR